MPEAYPKKSPINSGRSEIRKLGSKVASHFALPARFMFWPFAVPARRCHTLYRSSSFHLPSRSWNSGWVPRSPVNAPLKLQHSSFFVLGATSRVTQNDVVQPRPQTKAADFKSNIQYCQGRVPFPTTIYSVTFSLVYICP